MAMIVDALASQFADTLAALVKDEITMMVTVKDELQKLENKVRTIQAFLEDAERKAVREASIRRWLIQLRDAVYDADDIIDETRTHAENRARSFQSQPKGCCSPMLSMYRRLMFRHQIGSRIRSLNARLAEIDANKSGFNLLTAASPKGDSIKPRRVASDPEVEPDIVGVGIENDTNELVAMLTKSDPPAISVYAIVGMGGIGKTTLAQKINNHQAIKDSFQSPKPVWISVSKDYSDETLLKSIIQQIGGQDGGATTVDQLKYTLGLFVNQKKLFLTMDDVWDWRVWTELLSKPLRKAGAGSRVLITSRDERVAAHMKAVYVHRVQRLSTEESWSLICKIVFRPGEENDIEFLKDIGRQIAERCDGLPLAIKTIAGVLLDKEKRRPEWERVLKNPAWSMTNLPEEGVMGVLYLSYEDLKPHLKQCFIFCSLFPEDHLFMRHTLVQLWVAEGFVKEQKDMILEEVAKEYYRELLRRNLLQRDPRYYDEGGCRMHDLLRSLAHFLAQDEYYVGDTQELTGAAASSQEMKLRHLSVLGGFMEKFPETVKEHTSVRTLLFMGIFIMDELPEDLFQKLTCLRVADFSWTTFDGLPKSVERLIHLRYLDLSGSMIEELPESIGNLSNLQYLILQKCEELYELPKSIAKLYKLRSIDLHKTPVIGMPPGIGGLVQLNRVTAFAANDSSDDGGNWCSLEEIKSLTNLRTITIVNLEKAAGGGTGSVLKDKDHIHHLDLACSDDGLPYDDEEVKLIEQVFEERLFPPPSVEKFQLKGYYGAKLPRWIMNAGSDGLFSNLRRLDLLKCNSFTQLPPLGRLPQLDLLNIKGASRVRSIGLEFMGTGRGAAFPKLKSLKLQDMPEWTEWIWDAANTAQAMPCLESLQLVRCPSLRSLPAGLHHHAKALTALWIEELHSLTVIESFPSVKAALLIGNNELVKVAGFPSAQMMKIDGCPALLHDVGEMPSLKVMEWGDSRMEHLPEWLQPKTLPIFPAIERLVATVGEVSTLRRCVENGPDWPKIQYIPNVYVQVMNRKEFVFYTKEPYVYNDNIDAVDEDNETDAAADEEEAGEE